MRLGMRKKHSIWRFVPPVLCLLFIIGAHCLLKRAEPVFYAECSNYSNTAFTELVNRCVLKDMRGDTEYYRTIEAENGGINAVEADAAAINRTKAQLMIDIQNALNNDYPAYVKIPFGSLFGYSLLTYYGPALRIRVVPISVVDCAVEETFEDAGINYARHKLYLKFTVRMRYRGYLMDETEDIETSVPVAETVIAGEVPEYYGGMVMPGGKNTD